uniref:MHD domain-containing protein n=1 Tax=Leersia perrieri TaxID=77586 RepID=A0A0D9XZW9_9ORYZ
MSGGGCSLRAIWILTPQDAVAFSRRFAVVEKRWRAAWESEGDGGDGTGQEMPLPADYEVAAAFAERRKREGTARGSGIRTSVSSVGSDSWVDDPITRHIISLHINKEDGDGFMLWPVVLQKRGSYYILVLPLVDPQSFKSYERLLKRSDCGTSAKENGNLSSILFNLPCITGALMVAQVIGDIITGDTAEPEVIVSTGPSVGGLLDSLTGSIGISARPKPIAAPVAAPTASVSSPVGAPQSESLKGGMRLFDKDSLRNFILGAMPFGTPQDLNYANVTSIRTTGFSADPLPTDQKQPAWKPNLYKGRQRTLFSSLETLNAALYDRDDVQDFLSVSGQVTCRAELEGLPDVSLPLSGLKAARVEVSSFHHCVQASEPINDKQNLIFQPPLGNFVLMHYQASCNMDPPVKGFYQLSMVSENEGAFLFKLRLMEGYKSPFLMEFCMVTMPFPRRRVASYDGNPSVGTVSMTEHSIEWRIVSSGRGLSGRSIEATFSGTVRFHPITIQRVNSSFRSFSSTAFAEDSDSEQDSTKNGANLDDHIMEKMNKDLQAVDLEEPLSWQAYNYAKVSFKIVGGTLSGLTIDPKSCNGLLQVTIYPSVKAPVEYSMQASSGDYILWNTLGKCPSAALPKEL